MNWFFDGFSGMGGVSLGIERAGCRVAVAVNHDDRAIKAHAANHPYTAHLNGDIRNVNIRKLAGRLIRKGIWRINLWWSAECTHFSNAKGGASRDADSETRSKKFIGNAVQVEMARLIVKANVGISTLPALKL